MGLVARLDDYGTPAWIGIMVLSFVLFWPVGLAVLAFLLWSGRMGCWKGSRGEWRRRWQEMKHNHHGHGHGHSRWQGGSSGNVAFDEYREETLKRLEAEQKEFYGFLDRLRQAKDRQEFDQFMAERRGNPNSNAAA